jgi:hypothetical protein
MGGSDLGTYTQDQKTAVNNVLKKQIDAVLSKMITKPSVSAISPVEAEGFAVTFYGISEEEIGTFPVISYIKTANAQTPIYIRIVDIKVSLADPSTGQYWSPQSVTGLSEFTQEAFRQNNVNNVGDDYLYPLASTWGTNTSFNKLVDILSSYSKTSNTTYGKIKNYAVMLEATPQVDGSW